MLNPKAIRTISDLRENPLGLIKAAEELGEPIYLFNRATPKGVFLDLAQYQQMRTLLEDYHDALMIKEVLEDPTSEWIPLKTFWKQHKFVKNVP